jgi:hypothetical protein
MPRLNEGKVEKGRLESSKNGRFQKSVRLFAKASFTYLHLIASIGTAAASNECPSPDPASSEAWQARVRIRVADLIGFSAQEAGDAECVAQSEALPASSATAMRPMPPGQ